VKPIRTDFRGYEGKFVATDKRTGKILIADEDPKVVMEQARKRDGVVVGGRVPAHLRDVSDSAWARRSGRYHLGMAQATRLTKSEVERRRAAAERARGMLGRDPSRSFSDELIAERRAEARAEDREEEARQRRAGR
jgi:hypothetical protein